MIVIGKHCLEINDTGKTAHVDSFSKDAGSISSVRIVDAICAYDCPLSGNTYLLVMRNGLSIPGNENNLIPPFLMSEAGLDVNTKPKIHCKSPTVSDHSIFDEESGLRIPLMLNGIFSSFETRQLSKQEMTNPDDYEMIFLSPDSPVWNPYDESYAENEAALMTRRGEIVSSIPPRHDLLEAADISALTSARPSSPTAVDFFDDEVARIDAVIASSVIDKISDEPDHEDIIKFSDDPGRAQVANVSTVLDPAIFLESLNAKAAEDQFGQAAGAMFETDDACVLFEASIAELQAAAVSAFDASVGAAHAAPPKGVSAETISKVFRVDHETAKNTLDANTQLNRRDSTSSLSRNFSTNDRMLRYRRLDSFFFTDTFYVTKKAKSKRGNLAMQLFVSDKGFVFVVPMKSESEFPLALKLFAKEIGVPDYLIADPARAQKSKEVVAFCHKIGTTLRILEERTQWANRAELYIGLMKEAIRKDMREENSPLVLWDYCAELRARMFNLTAKNLFQNQGKTPHTATFGTQGDISNVCQFKWYQWVYFRDGSANFPFMKEVLGRYLGPTKNEGNEMTMSVLKANGIVVPRTGLRRLTPAELHEPVEIEKRRAFDAAIHIKLGSSLALPPVKAKLNSKGATDAEKWPWTVDDVEQEETFDPIVDELSPNDIPEADAVDANGKPMTLNSVADVMINCEVLLPQGESSHLAKVVRRTLDSRGRCIGEPHSNPIMNTAVYDVEFPDGTTKAYGANVIAENLLAQCDADGCHSQLLAGIQDHRTDGTQVLMKDRHVTSKRGNRGLRKTTVGWSFHVKWKDGSSNWVSLKLLKESNPVEVAEYVKARNIDTEPAFAWWVPYTLRRMHRIIAAVNSRVRKTSHKYGLEIPTSVRDAFRIDKLNGDTFWADALKKEMTNVGIAFKILENDERLPVGYKKSSGHLIFDVKMDFTRKARWVKDGHRTPDPETSKYAGVVSRESIRVLLTHAALHGIDVMAADIRNAYLQAPTSEKHYVICGEEFGLENVGKRAIIVRALYGGKCAGRDFWHHLRSCMEHMGFSSSPANPDVWYRSANNKNREEYYEYVLLYTDDCLVLSERADSVLRDEIGKYFELKEESIGKPSQYLGGKLREVELDNGTKCWAFGSTQYVHAAVENVETYLKKRGLSLPAKAPEPLTKGYRPEIDTSPELGSEDASYYHSLIGVLRWIVELGRADLTTEVSMMSSHLALPREGHFQEVLHIFAHLKKHHNAEMVFDPSEPVVDMSKFPAEDWGYSIYSSPGEELKEPLPPNMPKPLGKEMVLRVFVDADHAGESLTRRSRSGFIVFLNNAPIYWSSKKQTSCETSTYGSELVAMKQAAEYVRGLRYKLRMFGIPVTEPAFVFGDNQSVLCNTTKPESMLKKKAHAISYHFIREGCARNEWRTSYINTHYNPADLMTKPLVGLKRWGFVRMLLRHL